MMKLIQGDAYNDNEKYYHSVSLNVVVKVMNWKWERVGVIHTGFTNLTR